MKKAVWGCFTVVFILPSFMIEAASVPPVFVDNINEIPDLCQSDTRADFDQGGKEYCCIVAISNSLMWLGQNGYPNLIDPQGDPFTTQVSLSKQLASPEFMNTNPKVGTGTPNIMRGLKKYTDDHGYSMKRYEYRGWRKHPVEMAARSLHPSLEWIKEGVFEGAVWLNVGWYQYDLSNDTYKRVSGHWVTVVGYGENEVALKDPNTLILHDPSARTGMSLENEYVQIESIQSGRLTGAYSGLPRNAKGFLRTVEGMHVKPPADCAIIDGALLMVLDRPGTPGRLDIESHEVVEQLNEARWHLTGPDKNLQAAQLILRSILTSPSARLKPEDRCYVLVYLGYIEDLQGNRKKAKSLFQKAANVQGSGFDGIRNVGVNGIRNPVTHIKHLEKPKDTKKHTPPQAKNKTDSRDVQIVDQIGSALIFNDPLIEQAPAKNLDQKQQMEIFEDLVLSIDRYFSFFEHKKIDWNSITQKYRNQLKNAKATREYYELLYMFIRELKDAHSWLKGYETATKLNSYAPSISIRLIKSKPVVVHVTPDSEAWQKGIRPGWIIHNINGKPAEQYMLKLQDRVRVTSSHRNLQEVLTRKVLCGQKNSSVTVDFLSSEGKQINGVKLIRKRSFLTTGLEPSFSLTSLKYIDYGIHSSGYGYIRIKSFKGRIEIADEFDQALEIMRNTKGLIIDIRDNPGGYGTSQKRIIGRFLTEKSDGAVSFIRNGPKHSDFKRTKQYISPSGKWQYSKPVGLLMNPVTGSASDLFAARFISTGRCITMGRTTHGNLTGDAVYVLLPCNIFVRVSTGYISDANGRIIEGDGNKPEVLIEPTIEDARKQIDGVLERAFIELKKKEQSSATFSFKAGG